MTYSNKTRRENRKKLHRIIYRSAPDKLIDLFYKKVYDIDRRENERSKLYKNLYKKMKVI